MYKRGTKSAQVNVESVRGHLSIVFHERCKQVSRQWEQSVELEGDRERIHMEEEQAVSGTFSSRESCV